MQLDEVTDVAAYTPIKGSWFGSWFWHVDSVALTNYKVGKNDVAVLPPLSRVRVNNCTPPPTRTDLHIHFKTVPI